MVYNKEYVNMNSRIAIQPVVCHGKPVVKGTRVLVANILGALGAGDSIEDVLEDYPNISRADVLAAIEFGAELARFTETPYEASA